MADIKKNVNINVNTKGAKKATQELTNVNDAINKTGKSSRTFDRNMKGNAAMSANASKNFSKQAQGMQGVLVPAYAEVAARVFALTAAYNALVKAADYSILLQGQQLYAERTGRNLGIVAKQLQEAAGYMLDFSDASRAAGLSGTAGLTTDQMVEMTKAARTASIALGVGMEDAFSRLTRGIVKGEPEILDEIGVLMRLDKVYEDYGKTLNKNAKNLTESEKLQARFAFATGQITTNMGDLSSEVDSNAFAKIGAQARDALLEVGSTLSGVLKPLANFFDSFKEGIYLVMALVTRSLIGKIFPAFEKFGEKLQTAAAKAEAAAERSRAAFSKADAEYLGTVGRSAVAARGSAKTRQLMTMKDFKPGAGIQRAVEARDLKAQQKYLDAAAGRAQEQLNRGGKLDKRFQIQSEEALRAVQQRVKELTVEIRKMGTATENAGKGLRKATAYMQAGWNSVKASVANYKAEVMGAIAAGREAYMNQGLIGGLKANWANAMDTMGGRFTKFSKFVAGGISVLGSSVANMLSKGLSIFSTVAMAGFLIDSVIGASQKFSKSNAAANALKDGLNSIIKSLNKGEKRLDLTLSNTFSEAVSNVNFKANLATQLSDTFESAMRDMDFQTAGVMDGMAKFLDWFKGLFGYGVADAMADGFEEGMKALTKMGAKAGGGNEKIGKLIEQAIGPREITIEGAGTYDQYGEPLANAINAFKEGKASIAQFKIIAERLDSTSAEKLRTVLQGISDEAKSTAMINKELAKQTNDQSAAVSKLSKAFADLKRSMTIKTDFDALRDGFNDSKTAFKQLTVDTVKYQLILDQLGDTNALPQQLEGLKTAQAQINKAKADITAADESGDKAAKKRAEDLLKQGEALKAANIRGLRETNFLDDYTAEDFAAGMQKGKFGGRDINKLVKDQLTLQERQAKLKREIALYDKTSFTAIEKTRARQKQVLKNEKDLLLAKEDILKSQQKGVLTDNQKADFDLKRYNLEQDLIALERDKTRELELQARLRGYEVTQVERIANKMNEMIGAGGTDSARRYINTEILIKQGELLAEKTRLVAEYFKSALDKVADAFRSGVQDTVTRYYTGEEKSPFTETLGKGFLSAGAAGIAELTTKGIMGRSGLLGSAVGSFFSDDEKKDPNSFFNQLFPKTQEEILQDQLKELQQLKSDLESGNWTFNEKVMDRTNTLLNRIVQNTAKSTQIIEDTGDAGENSGFRTSIIDPKSSIKDIERGAAITGDTLKEKLTEGAKDFVSEATGGFDKILANFELNIPSIFNDAFGMVKGLLGSANTGLGGIFGFQDLFGFGGFFANGGIAKGGFKMYANGGVATQPHIGVVGEGKYNEAIVPLPDGKSIPVMGNTGGNTNNITVNVQVDSNGNATSETKGDNTKELGYMISQAVQDEIMQQQRPGGLLNSTGTRNY